MSRAEAAGETVDAITDAMLTASRLLVSLSARSIAEVDETITIAQFRVLVILETSGPVNLTSLAQRLDVKPSTATRMAERLVQAGLVSRSPSEHSRRELILDLTEQGRRTVREVTSRRRDQIGAVVAQMPPETRVGLVDALNAFSQAGGEPPVAERGDGYWL